MKNSIFYLVLLGLVCLAVKPTQGSQELRDRLVDLAENILKNTKQQPVTVGQFTPTGLANTNNGPGIEQLLTNALESKVSGIVQENALFEVKGDYALVASKANPSLKVVRIVARLINTESGEELKESRVDAELSENRTIAEILQVTAMLDPDASQQARNDQIQIGAKEPKTHIHGDEKTLVSSSDKSPFAVELLVKPLANHESKTAQPRSVELLKGNAYVSIDRDELYEVKVYNNSSSPIAVSLSIDGIDMFHFSKDRNEAGSPRFTHTIVGPRTSFSIPGWHNSIEGNENYLSFLVTGYGQGAVSKAGLVSRGRVGVIHVQFSACTPLPVGGKSRSGNETGFGPPREVKQKAIAYEIEPPNDFVTIRYNRE